MPPKVKGNTVEAREALVTKWTEDAPEGAVAIELDGAKLMVPLQARTFSKGSVGFFGQTKVPGAGGRRYQVGITATLIGSKPE